MEKDVGKLAKKGIFWTAFFNGVEYIIRFGTSIVLARLLFPEDFGLMGLAMITIQFARRLSSFGFTMALIQRKDVKNIHFYTAFWFNLLLFGLITTIIFLLAPVIAGFFNNLALKNILRVIAFDFILQGFFSVPRAILMKKMDFKKVGQLRTYSDAVRLITPIGFALAGYGVWSLVFGTMLGSVSESILAFVFTRWTPKFRFKFQALKDIFSFGMWVNIITYLNYFIKNVDYFFIGKFLGAAQLGYYERAFNLMNLPRKRIQQTINNVLFSAYSKIQEDTERILKTLLKVTTYISIISYPLMIGLFFGAPALITVLYGPKWTATIYPFQVMCISGLIYTFDLTFDPVIMGKGLVSLQALRKFFHFVVLTVCVVLGLKWGINGVAWGLVVASIASFSFNLQIITSRLKLSFFQYLRAHRSALVYSSIQLGVLLGFKLLVKSHVPKDSVLMLLSVMTISVVTFFGAHLILRFRDVQEIFIDFFTDTKKILRKVPIINRLGFLWA